MTDDSDRRAHPRIAVELWVDERHGSATYFQHAADLSLGGMFLGGTIPHPAGTVVNLEFRLPGADTPVRVRAEVVGEAAEPLGMHLRFVELSDATRDQLARFIDARRD
jgi:uncharacterized protein (TIGR02266 family)